MCAFFFFLAAKLASSHSGHILYFAVVGWLFTAFLFVLRRQSLLPVFHIYGQKTATLKIGSTGGNGAKSSPAEGFSSADKWSVSMKR